MNKIKYILILLAMTASSAFAESPKDIDARIEVCKHSFIRFVSLSGDESVNCELRNEYLSFTKYQVNHRLVLLNRTELLTISKEVDKLSLTQLRKLAISCYEYSNTLN